YMITETRPDPLSPAITSGQGSTPNNQDIKIAAGGGPPPGLPPLTFTDAAIPLARVIENPHNHRRDGAGDQGQDDDELTGSIRDRGVLQPVIGWEEADGFHLVVGHRRCRCARRAGLETIPARKLSRPPTHDEIAIVALLENTQ